MLLRGRWMTEKTLLLHRCYSACIYMGDRSEKSDYSFAAWRELECQLPVAKEAKLLETFLTLTFGDVEQPGWNYSQPEGEAVQPQRVASPLPLSGWFCMLGSEVLLVLSPHQFVCGSEPMLSQHPNWLNWTSQVKFTVFTQVNAAGELWSTAGDKPELALSVRA